MQARPAQGPMGRARADLVMCIYVRVSLCGVLCLYLFMKVTTVITQVVNNQHFIVRLRVWCKEVQVARGAQVAREIGVNSEI